MAPKTKAQFEEIRQHSKTAIQAAALELFATKGFASTSISDIAKAAGISKGLMYNYFESKEELLRAIISEAVVEGEGLMNDTLSRLFTPKEQLIAIVEGTFHMVKSKLQYWKLLTSLAFQPELIGEFEWALQTKRQETLELLKNILAGLGVEDTEKEAYLFGAALDGILLQYFFLGSSYPLDEMKTLFIQRFCRY